jgi:putative ABC transport system permease protein
MNNSIYNIPVANLLLMLLPLLIVFAIYLKWSLRYRTILYASARMVLQLILVGFFLVTLFELRSFLIMSTILFAMLAIAGWIAIRPVKSQARIYYPKAFFSLIAGCLSVLTLVIVGVIRLDPWYEPRYLIPIAGMIFANAMNSVSLAAERYASEQKRGVSFREARNAAFGASLLPTVNAFFAVGLVSLPGMMTGQILAGISPLIAIRYQIMVMSMVFGASGISSAIFLSSLQKN